MESNHHTELQRLLHYHYANPQFGAGSENRTRLASLEDWDFTTKLYPQKMAVREGFEPSVLFWSTEL